MPKKKGEQREMVRMGRELWMTNHGATGVPLGDGCKTGEIRYDKRREG